MNTVLNFSYHGAKTVARGLRSAIVSPDMPATIAAKLAEMNSLDVLVVKDASGETKGSFFPDYLREHLPVNPHTALRVCPIGPHMSAVDPCRTHHVPTEPYLP